MTLTLLTFHLTLTSDSRSVNDLTGADPSLGFFLIVDLIFCNSSWVDWFMNCNKFKI